MFRLFHTCPRLAALCSLSFISLFLPSFNSAADIIDGAPAIDLLGQYDHSSLTDPAPSFTKNGAHDYPNRLGFDSPESLALDSVNHRLFVLDWGGSRVLVFNLNSADQLQDRIPDNVIGQADFGSVTYGEDASHIFQPRDLEFSASQNLLFVADAGSSRVLVFDVALITNGEAAVNVLGQTTFGQSTSGLEPSALIGYPTGLALDDANHRLFVSDSGAARILQFDVATITNGEEALHVFGQPDFESFSVTAPPTAASLRSPGALDLDAANQRLFVADSGNNRVLVFDVTSPSNGMSAVHVICQDDFTTSASHSANPNGCSVPTGVAYDEGRGRLYVADQDAHRVTVYQADPSSLVDGLSATDVLGQGTLFDDFSGAGPNGLYYPSSVLVRESDGALMVTDRGNHRVLFYDAATVTSGEDAIDLLGQYEETSSLIPQPDYFKNRRGNGPNRYGFDGPTGVALDAVHHRLFVADSHNSRVLVFTLNASNEVASRTPSGVLGQPNFSTQEIFQGATASSLYRPYQLAYDSQNDRLFVSDYYDNRVLVFDTTTITNNEPAVFVLGQSDFTTSDYGTSASTFDGVDSLMFDPTRKLLYVSDSYNSRVLIFDVASISNGESAVHVLGQPTLTSGGSGNGTSGFYYPTGLALDTTSQRLFVVDHYNSRVMVFDVAEVTDGEAASNVLCQGDFTSTDYGTSATQCSYPLSATFDNSSGRLFVGDTYNDRVLVFDATSVENGEAAVHVLGVPDFDSYVFDTSVTSTLRPFGMALDQTSKRLWVADNSNRVAAFPVDYNISFSDTAFQESEGNDGTVTTTAEVKILNEKFSLSSGTLTRSVHYVIGGVPAGLTEVVTVTSPTTAVISFTGAASAHAASDSVSSISFQFLDATFVNVPADQLSNSSATFGITFFDTTQANPTATPTWTPTWTPTYTPTPTNTPTSTPTSTPIPKGTVVPVSSPTPMATPSVTPVATPSVTPASTPEATATPITQCFGGSLPKPKVKVSGKKVTVTLPTGIQPSVRCEVAVKATLGKAKKPSKVLMMQVPVSAMMGVFKKLPAGKWNFSYSVKTTGLGTSQDSGATKKRIT